MDSVASHTIAYEGVAGRVLLTVPWDFQSGRIPPPVIKFYSSTDGELTFDYAGSVDA